MDQNKNNFSLQLVVIGILITSYLQVLPSLIKQWEIFGIIFNFELLSILIYFLGFLWFLCLLFGTFYLIENIDRKYFYKIYQKFFFFNNVLTIFFIAFIFSLYVTQIWVFYPIVILIVFLFILVGISLFYIRKWLIKKEFLH